MSANLTAEQRSRIRRLLASGSYASEAEVIEHALDALEAARRRDAALAELRHEVQLGLDSGTAGPFDVDAFLAEAHARFDAQGR